MRIAYLASEIPSVSATFVYREIVEVEAQGHEVVPFATHRCRQTIAEHNAQMLHGRTVVLYEQPARCAINALLHCLAWPHLAAFAVWHLIKDLRAPGSCSRLRIVLQFIVALALARQLVRRQCEHLHVHFAHTPATIGMYASMVSGVPFSITAHANDIFERPVLLSQKIQRAGAFITISEYNRRYLYEKYGDAKRIEIIRCGIGQECGTHEHSHTTRLAQPLHILSIGRLVEKKGFDVLLHALAELDALDIQWKCTLAGEGPERQNLERIRAKLGLGDERLQMIGAIPPDYVSLLLAESDIFALPCRTDVSGDMDGIPVVLMEAMGAGLPCISTRLSGIPELLNHNRTGILLESGDSQGLAHAIAGLADSPRLRRRLGEAGRHFVMQEFSRNWNVARLINLISRQMYEFKDKLPKRGRDEPESDRHHYASAQRNRPAAEYDQINAGANTEACLLAYRR